MALVLRLVETRTDSKTRSVDVLEISRPGDLRDIANLGLTLPEAKQLLTRVQHEVVAVQARDHTALRPDCASCGGRCQVKDWRSRRIVTSFGGIVVRLLRFRCPGCGRSPVAWTRDAGAATPTPAVVQAMRTEIGRPHSSMRLRTWTATSTSVARRWSVRERSPSPITCLNLPIAASARACFV